MKRVMCVLLFLCLWGCAVEHPQEMLRMDAGTDSYTVRQGYQAICRELLHAAQAEFGENRVHYELWPDTEEALIYASYPKTRGADWTIQINSDGPGTCRVKVVGLNEFQRSHAATCVERTFARMAAGK